MFRLYKRADPTSPPANSARVYYDNAGPGYNTPVAIAALDENGAEAMLGHFGVKDYRLLKVTVFTSSSGIWTPQAGCQAAYVEVVGGGGQGGGAATSSSTASVGSGGGGGAYAAAFLTGISSALPYVVGAGGSGGGAGATGGNGGDTSFNTNSVVAKGGSGGTAMAAGSTVALQAGGAGGLASSSTGDLKLDGSIGGQGTRDSAAIGMSGWAGAAAFLGIAGANGKAVVSGGAAGNNASAAAYGSGGGGAATTTTAAAGGTGTNGLVRIWELA